MNSSELLTLDDRCRRSAFFSQSWERWSLAPVDVLRRSIDEALVAETDDVGIAAGDNVMTYFSNRGVDTKQNDLYGMGVHLASMADVITTVLRGPQSPYGRPQDILIGENVWESGCFLEASGVRLRALQIVDRFSPERLESLKHSWKVLEGAIYELPVTLVIVVLGANREGRWHGPWSKGNLHPVGRNGLRFKRQNGKPLRGEGWKQVFREECDHLSRDFWIDQMREDGVLAESLVSVEIPVPHPQVIRKVRGLAMKKLARIRSSEKPEVQPSQCWGYTPCPFTKVCWQFRSEPTDRDGFVKVAR